MPTDMQIGPAMVTNYPSQRCFSLTFAFKYRFGDKVGVCITLSVDRMLSFRLGGVEFIKSELSRYRDEMMLMEYDDYAEEYGQQVVDFIEGLYKEESEASDG